MHTLVEDRQLHLIPSLRKRVVRHAPPETAALYLIQIYPGDYQSGISSFISYVGFESPLPHPELDAITLPGGRFLVFEHAGGEAEIDAVYVAIQAHLAGAAIQPDANFDYEEWRFGVSSIEIFIPLSAPDIAVPRTIACSTLLSECGGEAPERCG